MKKIPLLVPLLVFFMALTIVCSAFAGDDITVGAGAISGSQSKSSSQAGAVSGSTSGANSTVNSLNVVAPEQTMINKQNMDNKQIMKNDQTNLQSTSTDVTTTTSASINAPITATTGPSSANINLEQTFEATEYKRPHIQGGGFPVPGLMSNFGPFFDKSWWNIMSLSGIKIEFTLTEAENLIEGGSGGITSHSRAYTKGRKPTSKIRLIPPNAFDDNKQFNDWKEKANPEEIGIILVEGKLNKSDSYEIAGKGYKDAMAMGATHILVFNNGASFDNKGSTLSAGIGTVGSIISGGAQNLAGSTNLGVGFTAGKVGTKASPFFQGVALILKDGDYLKPGPQIPSGTKMLPQSLLEKKYDKEQTVTK